MSDVWRLAKCDAGERSDSYEKTAGVITED